MILAAMEEDRIEVFYQPIYSTTEKCFVSAEALVRIRENDGSIVSPGKFVPVAEKTGLISQIGQIVFEKTCAFIGENSLDDFGSGESNLNYIVEMPVSIVKFDRGMSQAYFADKKAKFVMEAAMHMIHDLKLKIVSEGVETKEQMEKISSLGIDYIQGYYFSKPLPGDEFLQYIKRENGC